MRQKKSIKHSEYFYKEDFKKLNLSMKSFNLRNIFQNFPSKKIFIYIYARNIKINPSSNTTFPNVLENISLCVSCSKCQWRTIIKKSRKLFNKRVDYIKSNFQKFILKYLENTRTPSLNRSFCSTMGPRVHSDTHSVYSRAKKF